MLGELAWRSFSFAYGAFNLIALAGLAAFRDGAFTKGQDAEEKKEFIAAQKRYWNLETEPLPGFTHQFFTTRSGTKLHYVVNSKSKSAEARNIIIFIHGFPDSFLLWRRLLKAPGLQSSILIAVDLPGYGGSDGLQTYDANTVLETLAAFILGMREIYVQENSKVVVVSHDWGGVVASRLASEASTLADRWVVAGAVIPQLMLSNTQTLTASSKQMLHTYLKSPLNFRLVKRALSTLSPVFGQIGRSFYIFIFNLPWPLSTFSIRMGNFWFMRIYHKVSAGLLSKEGKFVRNLNAAESADWLAMSSGPGREQLGGTSDNKYPEAVKNRVDDYGMSEKIRIYRERLFSAPWEKSLETVIALSEIPTSSSRSTSGAGLFEDGPPGALKAPATVIMGRQDMAFDQRLALDGARDYLVKGSQVLLIDGAGHWLPFEGLGAKVLEDVAEWAVGKEQRPLKERFDGLPDVKFVVEK